MQIDEGDFIEGDYEMIMPESSQIRLSVTGSVDYYFTIYNILPDDTGT